MSTPQRLVPLLEQYDWACLRLLNRMTGPEVDSGTGTPIPAPPMTDDEYLWEPVPGCWSVRRRADGPGSRATLLRGAGELRSGPNRCTREAVSVRSCSTIANGSGS
jgi:hypothetical protein